MFKLGSKKRRHGIRAITEGKSVIGVTMRRKVDQEENKRIKDG